MNALELLNSGSHKLKKQKIKTHRLDSEILLSKVLNKSREQILISLNQNMKNTITLLIFSLFVTTSFSQTPSFTVYYFNADRSNEGEIAAAYDDFFEGVEFKSGGAYLERMDRGNVDGSHRLVRFGDTENWGLVEPKTREQWAKHMSDLNPLVESRGPRYTGRILGSNGVNPATKPYIQIYDLEVSNPAKWLAAFAKLIEDTKDSANEGMVVYGTYDVGAPMGVNRDGTATHWVALGADNLGELIMAKVEGEKYVDEWTEYHQTKGETKILNHYSLRILKDYGSFN